jgi:hypothetical protein
VLVVAGGYDVRLAENREHLAELQGLARELGVEQQVLFVPSFTDRCVRRDVVVGRVRRVAHTGSVVCRLGQPVVTHCHLPHTHTRRTGSARCCWRRAARSCTPRSTSTLALCRSRRWRPRAP